MGVMMTTNIDKYKAALDSLIKLGDSMELDLAFRQLEEKGKLSEDDKKNFKKFQGTFEKHYQRWYTESSSVIKQLIPDRSTEFENLYKGDGKRKEINSTTYNLQDWLNGIRAGVNIYKGEKYYNDFAIVLMRFRTQLEILKTVRVRFESSLLDIRQVVQADLFDSEIDAARELSKHGFLRGAGAIAGVILEKHLGQVSDNHKIKSKKKDPTINDYNDLLKNSGIIEVPTWRQIQRLGDLRNLCDHNKQREPTSEEVTELIDGTEKITKSLF